MIETSSLLFSLLAAVLTLGAVATGILWHRHLPLRICSNCGVVVCRRCSERRREVALCPPCATAESRAESAEFGRVLLAQQRRRTERRLRNSRTALAALVPGYGMAVCRDMFGTGFVLAIAAFVISLVAGVSPPFDAERDFGLAGPGMPAVVLVLGAALVYGLSLASYLARQGRLDAQQQAAPVRSRVAQATHHSAEAA